MPNIPLCSHLLWGRGIYDFIFQSELDCDSVYRYNVEIITTNLDVELDGSTLSSLQEDAIYQWYDCQTNEPITGAVYQNYMVKKSGEYKVRIDIRGCLAESDCYFVSSLYDRAVFDTQLKIYPNPAESTVTVRSDAGEIRSVQIIDMMGIVMASYACSGTQHEIDVSCLPGGFYMIQIETEWSVFIKRVLKN